MSSGHPSWVGPPLVAATILMQMSGTRQNLMIAPILATTEDESALVVDGKILELLIPACNATQSDSAGRTKSKLQETFVLSA